MATNFGPTIIHEIIDWLIEQFYYVTFWHSKVKTNTFIKYHTPVYDKKKIHNKKASV